MNVTHYQRQPNASDFSMERLFASLRNDMPKDIECRLARSRFRSRGLLPRACNLLEAIFCQGDVNHITGDVHYLTFLLRKGRTVLTVHDCGDGDRLTGWRRRVYDWVWFELPLRRSTVITAVSEATARDLIHRYGCPRDKVQVIPDCVPNEFRNFPQSFNDEKPCILQIGTRNNKNLLRVARALEDVSCRLEVVGRLTQQQSDALSASSVEYTSSSSLSDAELLEKYRQCDMLVFASTFEGFGMPIVEAQAVGRPVVTSNIAPMTEVAGAAAYLVDPFDVASIRHGVESLISDETLRANLVEKGLRNVERFRAAAISERYANVYRELYERQTGRRHSTEAGVARPSQRL